MLVARVSSGLNKPHGCWAMLADINCKLQMDYVAVKLNTVNNTSSIKGKFTISISAD